MTKKESRILTELTYWLLSMFLVGAAMVACQPAYSQTAIHAGGHSYHLATGHKVDYTSSHDLIGVEAGPYLAATFRNSYGRRSYLAGYGFSKDWGHWRGPVYVGAVRGYRSCYGDEGDKARVCPMAFPSLHYTKYRFQPGVLLFGEALALTVRVELY